MYNHNDLNKNNEPYLTKHKISKIIRIKGLDWFFENNIRSINMINDRLIFNKKIAVE